MNTYAGRIDTSARGDAGFRVKVFVGCDQIEVVSFDGEQWSWPLADVVMERAGTTRFLLTLGGESLYFTPDDPLSFSTSPIAVAGADSTEPGWLRRRIEAARTTEVAEPAVGESEWSDDGAPVEPPVKRRHVHVWSVSSSVGAIRRRCAGCGHVSIDLTGVVSRLDETTDDNGTREGGSPELVASPHSSVAAKALRDLARAG